jgi:hypothetical protein
MLTVIARMAVESRTVYQVFSMKVNYLIHG